ncbi:MAG: 50S ribosomal protein L32 [Bacteroidota bacterium]
MAHPKSRISKQRKRKRRTHYKATAPTLSVDSTSGETHLRHRAHRDADGNLVYRGSILIAADVEVEEDDTEGED